MRVVVYHPVLLPVSHYGGTERVVMWLVDALHKMGHQVTVFAAPGSLMPRGIECLTDRDVLIKRASEFDVLHGATQPDPEIISAFQGRFLVTIHGNGKPGEVFHPNSVFVSRNHAERHGATQFVYNGIDLSELDFSDRPRNDRFLFLSKTSWKVKNLKGAIRMMSRLGKNFWIAGGNRPLWLKAMVGIRRLFGLDWKWVGSVNQSEKSEFLKEGKAMVFPILWNEPFGLVVVESLAAGTPVLANPYGSLPELLAFAPQCLMKNEQDWEAALNGKISLPTAHACRQWVESNFSHFKMAEHYLKLYETVRQGHPLNDSSPITRISATEIGSVE